MLASVDAAWLLRALFWRRWGQWLEQVLLRRTKVAMAVAAVAALVAAQVAVAVTAQVVEITALVVAVTGLVMVVQTGREAVGTKFAASFRVRGC